MKSFRKTIDSHCVTVCGPWQITVNSYVHTSSMEVCTYWYTCTETGCLTSFRNASQICHFTSLLSAFRLNSTARACDINYARLKQASGHILGVSFKKSICDLKEILWGLCGLSNTFCDYSLHLGLDLFLS